MKPVEEFKLPESNLPLSISAKQAAEDCKKFYSQDAPGTGSQVGTIAGPTDVTGSRPAATSTGTPTQMAAHSPYPVNPNIPDFEAGTKKWGS